MSDFLITPILLHYKFLDELASEALVHSGLGIKDDEEKYKEFKMSIFFNFNQYLNDRMMLLPDNEGEELLNKVAPMIEKMNEEETIKILSDHSDLLNQSKGKFLNIIKNLKK